MRTPESITREIREASDIVEVIGQYVQLRRAGRNFRGLCPFHQEKTPSFNVHPAEQYFKCFGCGRGGDVFTFLELYNSVSFSEARQILADRAGISVEAARGSHQGPSRAEILRVNGWAQKIYQQFLQGQGGAVARSYLERRGLAPETIERFGLGYAPDAFDFLVTHARKAGHSDKLLVSAGLARERAGGGIYDVFRNRVLFPIHDPVGQVVGFGGRTLGDDPAKYLNTPETAVFNKSRLLYGVHLTRRAFEERGRAVVVEGYTDVLMAHQHGFDETVAALGTSMTEHHADMLRRYVPRVVLVFDADAAGQRAADRAVAIAVRSELEVFIAQLPQGQDPCDLLAGQGPAAFDAALNSATPALEFKWQQTLQGRRDSGSGSRAEAVREFVSFLGSMVAFGGLDPIQRGLVVNRLTGLLGVTREEVNSLLQSATRQAAGDRGGRPGAAEASSGTAVRSQDALQAAALEVLSVICCEPGLYAEAAEIFDPGQIRDPQLRRIAGMILGLIEQFGEFHPSEILEKCTDPADAARVVDLIERGRAGGPLAIRLEEALNRIKAHACAEQCKQVSREIVAGTATADEAARADQDRKLAEFYSQVRNYAEMPNFAGIRKLR